jgi:ANTAR domain
MHAMAAALAEPGDLSQALQRIVVAATSTIPGADYASITVRHGDGRLETSVSTDPLVVEADEMQYELREGPCYDAVTSDTIAYSRDLSNDPQWPQFGPRVAKLGLLSQKGVRMGEYEGDIAGLNLYARSRKAFEDSNGLPELFASHASVALGYATKLQSLAGALGTRETIGQAVGILMERYDMTSERAFEFLIRTSQNSNTKLRDIAQEVVNLKVSAQQA